MKINFLKALTALFIALATTSLVACGGGDDGPTPSPTANVHITPNSVSLLCNEGSSASVYIATEDVWQISDCPDWLHLTALSGQGGTSVTLTAKTENFSSTARTATLTVTTSVSSATFVVTQDKYFQEGLDVSLSNMTIMSDGFAADMTFGNKAIGYREAYFTESDIRSKTDRDIYNMLMQKTEYNKTADITYSETVAPQSTIIYCVAAYGNESNPDGSHKYGPMTMQRITTPSATIYADMYPSITYNSSRWTATASKYGTYGTRCAKYYYFAFSESASYFDAVVLAYYLTPALLPHAFYKPIINEDPGGYAVGAQSFYYPLTNEIFFGLWGKDDNDIFSSETTGVYENRSSSGSLLLKDKISKDSSKIEEIRRIMTRENIEEIRKSMKVMAIQ